MEKDYQSHEFEQLLLFHISYMYRWVLSVTVYFWIICNSTDNGPMQLELAIYLRKYEYNIISCNHVIDFLKFCLWNEQ